LLFLFYLSALIGCGVAPFKSIRLDHVIDGGWLEPLGKSVNGPTAIIIMININIIVVAVATPVTFMALQVISNQRLL
jgi:hypothetical protein